VDAPFLLAREYPISLVAPAIAALAAFLFMLGMRHFPGRPLFTGLMASFRGMIIGGLVTIIYLFAQISGWAILLGPVLLIACGLTALATGIVSGLLAWTLVQLFVRVGR
jgi:hypothetical protein